eukprot:352908-Chlamydomonas_euryale.AAC.4
MPPRLRAKPSAPLPPFMASLPPPLPSLPPLPPPLPPVVLLPLRCVCISAGNTASKASATVDDASCKPSPSPARPAAVSPLQEHSASPAGAATPARSAVPAAAPPAATPSERTVSHPHLASSSPPRASTISARVAWLPHSTTHTIVRGAADAKPPSPLSPPSPLAAPADRTPSKGFPRWSPAPRLGRSVAAVAPAARLSVAVVAAWPALKVAASKGAASTAAASKEASASAQAPASRTDAGAGCGVGAAAASAPACSLAPSVEYGPPCEV